MKTVLGDRQKRELGETLYLDSDWVFSTLRDNTTFSTTSTSPVDITNNSITLFFEKETEVSVYVTAEVTAGGGGEIGTLSLYIDAGLILPQVIGGFSAAEITTGTVHYQGSVSAGSHTFKLTLESDTPSASAVSAKDRRLTITRLTE